VILISVLFAVIGSYYVIENIFVCQSCRIV